MQITSELQAKGDTQLASDWQGFYPGFHRQHPAYSPSQVLSAFVGVEAAQGIGSAVGKTGSTLGQIPGAAAKGAESVYANPLTAIGTFFGNLMNPNTWLRVAEVVAGIMILYVALKASMTPGGLPKAGKKTGGTVKDAGKFVAKKVILK
jgi:hypothetical protein